MVTYFNPELPDLFRFENGGRVCTLDDWHRRRTELLNLILKIEYGGMPPDEVEMQAEELHRISVPHLLNAELIQYRLIVEGKSAAMCFRLDVLLPQGSGPFPVVLTGDGCWRFITDPITAEVLGRGNILAQFSRVEIASDNYRSDRTTGIYPVFPEGEYGALSAWAWGYRRCIDFLLGQKYIKPDCITVIGHSRGGKAALLAGATDTRIALTVANNSGCGGAGCFRWNGPDSETLKAILDMFPYWFAPGLKEYSGHEASLPFDQHSLKALLAPRALLTTEALDDFHANPTGTWQTHVAAREAFRFLGVEKHLGIRYRPGEHAHTFNDWSAALDFMDLHFSGKPSPLSFDANPYENLPRCFTWSAPICEICG